MGDKPLHLDSQINMCKLKLGAYEPRTQDQCKHKFFLEVYISFAQVAAL
jgi:hypothetical protein